MDGSIDQSVDRSMNAFHHHEEMARWGGGLSHSFGGSSSVTLGRVACRVSNSFPLVSAGGGVRGASGRMQLPHLTASHCAQVAEEKPVGSSMVRARPPRIHGTAAAEQATGGGASQPNARFPPLGDAAPTLDPRRLQVQVAVEAIHGGTAAQCM